MDLLLWLASGCVCVALGIVCGIALVYTRCQACRVNRPGYCRDCLDLAVRIGPMRSEKESGESL